MQTQKELERGEGQGETSGGADGAVPSRQIWAAACVTPREHAQIREAADSRGLTMSGLLRVAVERAAGLVSPTWRLEALVPVRTILDEAGKEANAATYSANVAARSYGQPMRLAKREVADLMRLVSESEADAAGARAMASRVATPLLDVLSIRVVTISDDFVRTSIRSSQVRARITSEECAVIDAIAKARGMMRSRLLRTILLAEAGLDGLPTGTKCVALVTSSDVRLIKNSWRRWQNNAAQQARALARVRDSHVGAPWMRAADSARLDDLCAQAVSEFGSAMSTVGDALVALSQAGVQVW